MRTDLVLDALRMALAQREAGAAVELVHHSDRGSQYTSADYTQELDDHGVLASVGSSLPDACEVLRTPQVADGASKSTSKPLLTRE